MIHDETKRRIETIAERELRGWQPLPGGMISSVLKLEFATGAALVAKIGDGSHDLTIEAFMLDYLRRRSALPVPALIHAEADLLLMAYIQGESALDRPSLRHLGELLAGLHQVTSDRYGLHRDTLTGPIHQPNTPSPRWIPFFREQRLLYMTGVARGSGHLPPELQARLRHLADRLDEFLIEPEKPALIHGDMWRTNLITRSGRVVGVIDPALYYAHSEIELAYMTLFDGVGAAFFHAYQERIPVDQAFHETRRHIYNLYPLLTHIAIFGAKYLPPLEATLRRFGL